MSLLGVPRKRTGRLDLQGVIIGWLRTHRGPHIYNSDAALSTLSEAQRLRDFAFEPFGRIDEVRDKLLRYFCFLTALDASLPVSIDRKGIPVMWSWLETFAENKVERSLVAFEAAAVVFLLAAQLATSAAAEKMEIDASCKTAAKHFQEAAGLFDWLHLKVPLKFDFNGMVDLAPGTTMFLSAMCLAQAQEATYIKAALDGKSPALLSRIALQAQGMYADAHTRIGAESQLLRAIGKPLAAHLSVKGALMGGISWKHLAAAAEADDDCGRRIACLREARKKLAEAKQAACSQKVHFSLSDRVSDEMTAVTTMTTAAMRENDTVYLQRIPPAEALDRGAPALLVKAAPIPPELEAPAEDRWFAFLSIPAPETPPRQQGVGSLGGLLGAVGRAVFK